MKRSLLGLLAVSALAAAMTANAAEAPSTYHYGMNLDMAKVISIEQPNDRCEISTAKMTYRDSQGQIHVLEYLRQTPKCSEI